MIKTLYILFLLPILFSCQSEKSVTVYPNQVGDIVFDKNIDNPNFKRCLDKKDYHFGLYDYYQLGVTYFETGKYDKALENFEKQSKNYDFAENIYFRSKVSKIRNKDYLDLKSLALKSYDEGKTMKDGYTHHFNKVYRVQITEL